MRKKSTPGFVTKKSFVAFARTHQTSIMLTAAGTEALRIPACQRLKNFAPFRPGKVRCVTVRAAHAPSADETVSRRQALQGLAVLAASAFAPLQASAAGKSAEVGRQVRTPSVLARSIHAGHFQSPFLIFCSYLPSAGASGFSDFKPDKSKTPVSSIRVPTQIDHRLAMLCTACSL